MGIEQHLHARVILHLRAQVAEAFEELKRARIHGDDLTIDLAEASLNSVLEQLAAETKNTETTKKKG